MGMYVLYSKRVKISDRDVQIWVNSSKDLSSNLFLPPTRAIVSLRTYKNPDRPASIDECLTERPKIILNNKLLLDNKLTWHKKPYIKQTRHHNDGLYQSLFPPGTTFIYYTYSLISKGHVI